jgi:hypothetical protein
MRIEFWSKDEKGRPGPSVFLMCSQVPRISDQVWIHGVREGDYFRRTPYRVADVSWDFTVEEPQVEVILE